ncbi:MAG TPA: DUF2619 domain-containing protein [Symbiobacteriaceae bacterium]|jgi:glycopeptide antibiotics resistance protein|nr:DUF2619 domain-containing protein [Symbiobacteriaceae bacterium]
MDDRMMIGIRLARGLSAAIEVTALLLLLRMNNIGDMVRLNGYLGMVGPVIFITVSALGLAGSIGAIQPAKLVLIAGGVILIVLGTR